MLADNSVDSVVTDPPYGLTSARPTGRSAATEGAVMKGFMGLAWDAGVPSAEVWAEALRALKPGGYLLAFGGTRTYHRMAVAIEDGGFEIRDQIGWAFGSGFPKSHNGPWGGTALKPAWEPICVARKPLIGTVEANWREHGTGALNIDGCRIQAAEERAPITGRGGIPARNNEHESRGAGVVSQPHTLGRWPANLIHDGSDQVVALFPTTTSGAMKAGTVRAAQDRPGSVCYGTYGGNATDSDTPGDTGSAARFFYCAKADRADRNDGIQDPGPRLKSGATLRDVENLAPAGNHHPTVKPTDLMRYLCRLVTPASGLILDPFMGSGSTGRGAVLEGFRFIGIEREAEYLEIARARIDSARRQGHQPSLDLEAA